MSDMKNIAATFAALALTGCSTSSAGLLRSDVEMTLVSSKSPQSVATCAAESMIGPTALRNEADHYWVLRYNGFQIPVSRWDFFPDGSGGTRAELRATVSINTGDERVKACL